MVRAVLGRGGPLRVALDGATERCAPCSTLPLEPDQVAALTWRAIVRHRTRTGVDEDGTPSYGWVTVYDGPGVWSAVTSVEDDDGAGAATETATVTVPALEVALATTATVWDDHPRRWVVTAARTEQAGGVLINVTRRVDGDT